MWTLLTVLFWLGVAAGLLALYGLVAGRFLQIDPQPDAVEFVTASDGWRLGLSRYAAGQPLAGAPPVLLCPGLAMNGRLFDLGPERSLARYLAGHGYHVWVLDWRGRGTSERPRLWGSRRYTWCFDDYLAFDLPAALEAMQAASGESRVLAVGLGLGGLTLLLGAGGPAASRLDGIIALGSSAFFRRAALELPGWALGLLGRLRLEALVRIAAPLLGRVFPKPLGTLQNHDAIEPAVYRRALVNAVCSPSPREVAQLQDWLRRDLCTGLAEERDYRTLLGQVTAPVLLLRGIRDPLAPIEAVEQTAAALTGAEREVVQASRLQGMASNYGHLDLLIGANAPRDIYPLMLRWLDARAGVKRASGLPEMPRERPEMPLERPAPARTPPLQPQPSTPTPARRTAAELERDDSDEHDERDELGGKDEKDEKDDLDWVDGDVPRVPRPDDP